MTYTVTDMAEAQAVSLCWLSRQPGLPDIHSVRQAVAQLHPDRCAWCDYPTAELMRMLDSPYVEGTRFNAQGYGKSPGHHRAGGLSERAERDWWAMPGKARLRAIALAQSDGEEPKS